MEDHISKKRAFGSPLLALFVFLFCVFVAGTISLLDYYGVMHTPFFGGDPRITQNLDALCPRTVEQMGKACCQQAESGDTAAIVGSVYVNAKCERCPYPTSFLQIAPEDAGIMICDCDCG